MPLKSKRTAGISSLVLGVVGVFYFGSKIDPSKTFESQQHSVGLLSASWVLVGAGASILITQ